MWSSKCNCDLNKVKSRLGTIKLLRYQLFFSSHSLRAQEEKKPLESGRRRREKSKFQLLLARQSGAFTVISSSRRCRQRDECDSRWKFVLVRCRKKKKSTSKHPVRQNLLAILMLKKKTPVQHIGANTQFIVPFCSELVDDTQESRCSGTQDIRILRTLMRCWTKKTAHWESCWKKKTFYRSASHRTSSWSSCKLTFVRFSMSVH